jgi:hypothetical protein
MAHSLFEPAPEPLGERVWRCVKALGFSSLPAAARVHQPEFSGRACPDLTRRLDARGQQKLLEAELALRPITK